jgi:hypothetical protein
LWLAQSTMEERNSVSLPMRVRKVHKSSRLVELLTPKRDIMSKTKMQLVLMKVGATKGLVRLNQCLSRMLVLMGQTPWATNLSNGSGHLVVRRNQIKP